MNFDRDDFAEANTLLLENQLTRLEGGESATAFASAMGAISGSMLALLKSGQRVIAHRNLDDATIRFLSERMPRFGIESTFIDVNSPEHRQLLHDSKVRVLYFECISRETSELVDIPQVMREVKKINRERSEGDRIIVIANSTVATPQGLRPLEWGVDLVIHGLANGIGGFETEIGGAVIGSRKFDRAMKLVRKEFGALLSPRAAENIIRYGIPTLAVRFEQQQKNAMKVAKFLERHSKVESVLYPGLRTYPQAKLAKKVLKTPNGSFAPGTMISFRLKGQKTRSHKLADGIAKNSQTLRIEINSKDARLLHLTPGIESPEELISDLDAAFRSV